MHEHDGRPGPASMKSTPPAPPFRMEMPVDVPDGSATSRIAALLLSAIQFHGRRRRSGTSGEFPPWQRNQHRHLLAIATVLIAEQIDQVAFLKVNSNQNVSGGGDRE